MSALNQNNALEFYDVFPVPDRGGVFKHFQSCHKSVINQTCLVPHFENVGPKSFLYGTRCARSVLARTLADILPLLASRRYKIYIITQLVE